ncbi:MAG: B12-binding domain-containing radical SAM protein [Patescibacteria group bacterium]|nr:B12-binding domain-containing radical SAM protein [Patescibacteria group bacterium]
MLNTAVPERVALIIPPSGFLLDDRVFMTLGILRVAAVLERAGVTVEVLDLSGISNYTHAVEDFVRSSDSTLFGLTATTPQLPPAVNIATAIKALRPDAKVILGGPHVTLCHAAYKKELKRNVANGRGAAAMAQLQEHFDVLVAGDGEEAIFIATQPDAPKVVDADDPKSSLFLTDQMLEGLPWPARHLVDIESYRYQIEGAPALSLIAQLGCPFGCGFCGGRESSMLRRIRMRSSENIVQEMVHLWRTTGKTGFMFYDDELNVNKNVVELMERIARTQRDLGVQWKLRGFVKSELFTHEQAEVMYEAGFRWLLVGFESGAERILTNINKKASREDNSACMSIARKAGLKVKALMSIGHPGETGETIEETRRWLLDVAPADFDTTVITCYPGTPYYDQATRHPSLEGVWTYTFPRTGDTLHQVEIDYTRVADYYKGDPDGGYRAYVFTDTLSQDDLVAKRDYVERSVRSALNIPFNPGAPAKLYEHSMGQGALPPHILRRSAATAPST